MSNHVFTLALVALAGLVLLLVLSDTKNVFGSEKSVVIWDTQHLNKDLNESSDLSRKRGIPADIRLFMAAKNLRYSKVGPSTVRGWFRRRRLGPSSTLVLRGRPQARAQLERSVVVARQQAVRRSRGTCGEYRHIAANFASFEKNTGVQGNGGVLIDFSEGNAATVVGEGSWAKNHAARQVCNMGSCFNSSRPPCSQSPLPIFWYPSKTSPSSSQNPCALIQCAYLHPGVNDAFKKQGEGEASSPFARSVDTPEEACVLIADPGSIHGGGADTPCGEFTWDDLAHWSAVDGVGGRNHVLIMPGCLMACDIVGEDKCYGSIGQAVVASSNLWRGNMRPGFDVMLPQALSGATGELFKLQRQRGRLGETGGPFVDATTPLQGAADWKMKSDKKKDAKSNMYKKKANTTFFNLRARPRSVLVSFRGTTVGVENRWFQHRAVVAAVANDPLARSGEAVVIDVKRKHMNDPNVVCNHYESEHKWPSYLELLLNSSFGFSPGGGGPYSFRFLEILAAGAVPVVTDDLILVSRFQPLVLNIHLCIPFLRAIRSLVVVF
jgi:hypothetical protein